MRSGRRQRVQPCNHRHRCGARTPRAPKAQHEAADRRERVTVDSAYVDGTACPAAGAVHVEPRHAGYQRTADRRRPQRASPGSKRGVPALDNAHSRAMGGMFGRAGAHGGPHVVGAVSAGHTDSISCERAAPSCHGRLATHRRSRARSSGVSSGISGIEANASPSPQGAAGSNLRPKAIPLPLFLGI